MNKFVKFIHQSLHKVGKKGIRVLFSYGQWLSDETYVKLYYRFSMGKKLDLKNPRTFTEKLQWLKLYDHNPLYTTLVDKYAVKPWVAERIGEQYIIPTLGVWGCFDDIEFDKLPDQFVLKTTHGGGSVGVVICKDKSTFDKAEAKKKLERSMEISGYDTVREWPYKNVSRRIIAEKYMAPEGNMSDLTDYKWYCFNGEPKYCQVIQDRTKHKTIDFFDTEWDHQVFFGLNPSIIPSMIPSVIPPACPQSINIHIEIARTLSEGLPFSRIDLYEIEGKVYFGEVTFYPACGLGFFNPTEFDEILGQMIVLPKIS